MRCWDVLSAIHHRGIRMCIHVHIYIYIYIGIPRHGLLMWSAVWVLSCILLFFVLTVLMLWGRVLLAFLGSVVGSQHASGMRVIHDSSALYIVASADNAGCLDLPHQRNNLCCCIFVYRAIVANSEQ